MPPFVAYLQAGLSAIPIRADGSKSPATGWKEYTEHLPAALEAQGWENRFQGVGVICGRVSGNLEVVDLDEPSIVRPYLETLRSESPGLYERLCLVRTPRRNESGRAGCHVMYRCADPPQGNTKLAMSELEPVFDAERKPVIDPVTGEQRQAHRTLVETRGEGGYVLTVGCSPQCHPTGNLYEHVHGPGLTELEVLSTAERETLHRVARMFDRSVSTTQSDPVLPGYEHAKPGESPGDAFNSRATWQDILLPHGWQYVGERGGLKHWRRPGKTTGISATTGVLSKAGTELLTVFSTNASPFEGVNQNGRPGVSYSKFATHTLLNHHGDFQAAAKALLKLGYGTPARKSERKERVLRMTMEQAVMKFLDSISTAGPEYVSLGYPPLDAAIGGGAEPGELVVIGGLTSHGKSMCALQALRACTEAGKKGVIVSNEMPWRMLAKRSVEVLTSLPESEWGTYRQILREQATDYYAGCAPLFILESCRHIDAIEKSVAEVVAEFDVGLVVIDHAQLSTGPGRSRYEIITECSGRFKQMAIEHNIVVLVLSQFNRDAAKHDQQEAYHLRESGALEQDSDVVILVSWPWKQNPQGNDPGRYVFRVVKNRNRAIVHWEVEARFNPSRQTITRPDQDWSDETTQREFE